MKFQVKCKNRILKAIVDIVCQSIVIVAGVFLVKAAETPKNRFCVFVFAIFAVIFLGYILLVKGGEEVVNSLSIDGDTIKIKKLFSPSKVASIDENIHQGDFVKITYLPHSMYAVIELD